MNANELAPFATRRAWGEETSDYYAMGLWTGQTLASVVAVNAEKDPSGLAFITRERSWTWEEYRTRSDDLAAVLVGIGGCNRYEHLALHLPEGPAMHMGLLAAEKAGLTAVGLPIHGGETEIIALLRSSHSVAVLATEQVHRVETRQLFNQAQQGTERLRSYFRLTPDMTVDLSVSVVAGIEGPPGRSAQPEGLRSDEVFYLGATSGTTGLPKLVMMTQNRWFYFHQRAVDAGNLTNSDVFLSLLPAASAFGLWSAHFTPAILSAPTVTLDRFDAEEAIDLIVETQVSVLAGVTVQLIMMMNSPNIDRLKETPLRVAFTGGESVPAHKAMEFERRTGATVLQFYGSTETASISHTTLEMSAEVRTTTAGVPVPGTSFRLLDEQGRPVGPGESGRPAVRGPATSIGYFNDEVANARLFTADGWLQTEDIAELDSDGYLRIVGRASDFINRGGVKISPARIENELVQHPDIAMAAVIGVPDETYGERAWAFVVTVGGVPLTLDSVDADIRSRGHAGAMIPEHLEVLEEMPMASGGKVSREALREIAAQVKLSAQRSPS